MPRFYDRLLHASIPPAWRWVALVLFATLLSLSGLAPVGATKPPRLALLVGVSHYPQTGKHPWRPLHAHQDLVELRKVLIERHDFADKDVLVMEDEAASARAIRQAFVSHLIARAEPGAVLFFHFSGHGQQVRDRSGDENDGLDESIVPGDATEQGAVAGESANILDDELAAWLEQLGQRLRGTSGGAIIVSLDSCFSGTMVRGALVERGRSWDEALDGPRPVRKQPRPSAHSSSFTLDLEPSSYILLSATRSDQTAKERAGMGVYSRALVGALTRLPRGTSYRALMHEVSIAVRGAVANQTPEWEGNPDRLLFGAPAAPPAAPAPRFLEVLTVHGDELLLGVGKLHLVTAGSRYLLFQPGDTPPGPTTLLAEAEVTRVEPTTSWLRLLPRWQGRLTAVALLSARVLEGEHGSLTGRLRADWRWRQLLQLQGRSPQVHAELRLVPVVAQLNALGQVVGAPRSISAQAGTSLQLPLGALYQLEIRNSSPSGLWVAVIELGPDGAIQVLFPDAQRPGDGLIAPGPQPRLIPVPYVFEATLPHGTYTLKCFATLERTDFTTLAQEATTRHSPNLDQCGPQLSERDLTNHMGDFLLSTSSGTTLQGQRTAGEVATWSVSDALLKVVLDDIHQRTYK